MSEIRKTALGAVFVSGLLLSSCIVERETNFVDCDYNPKPQSTDPDDPIYLLDTTNGLTNYKLVLGENTFLRNQQTGELEWRVSGVKQEMFPDDEIVVKDNTTERTADIHFKYGESFIRADITTECNSDKPLTPYHS